MEKEVGFDIKAQMMNELLQGMEFANQLRNQIINDPITHYRHTSSRDDDDDDRTLDRSLLEKILCSFDKIITIAKLLNVDHHHMNQNPTNNPCDFHLESPCSLTLSSPRSENSHPNFHTSKKRCRRRKPLCTKRVEIDAGGSVSGLEGPLDDGLAWRKYGQKEIHGSKFPRAYYRCTHRYSQNCKATKKVQRSDEDPSIYQVIYSGQHTCTQAAHSLHLQAQLKTEQQPPPILQQQEVYMDLGPDGDLKIEPQEPENKAQKFRSFSFTSAPLEPIEHIDNYFLSCSPAFTSPATSDSNHFPVSPYQVTGTQMGLTIDTLLPDINEVNLGPNSETISSIMGDFEFSSLDQLPEIDPNFCFEF